MVCPWSAGTPSQSRRDWVAEGGKGASEGPCCPVQSRSGLTHRGGADVSSGWVVASWWSAQADSAKVDSVGLGGCEGHDSDMEVKVGQCRKAGHRIMGHAIGRVAIVMPRQWFLSAEVPGTQIMVDCDWADACGWDVCASAWLPTLSALPAHMPNETGPCRSEVVEVSLRGMCLWHQCGWHQRCKLKDGAARAASGGADCGPTGAGASASAGVRSTWARCAQRGRQPRRGLPPAQGCRWMAR